MTTINVSLEKVDYGAVMAVVTTDEHYPLSRRFLEDIVVQEIALASGVTLVRARQEWDFDKSARFDSELPGKKSIRVSMTRHDPKDDLFQKQEDGSYVMSLESVAAHAAAAKRRKGGQ